MYWGSLCAQIVDIIDISQLLYISSILIGNGDLARTSSPVDHVRDLDASTRRINASDAVNRQRQRCVCPWTRSFTIHDGRRNVVASHRNTHQASYHTKASSSRRSVYYTTRIKAVPL